MKLAILGAGAFGREHAARLCVRPEILLAIADCDEAVAESVAHSFNASVHAADGYDLIRSFEPNAVVIATPGHTHFEYARFCLEQRVPVLVEKPIASTSTEALELCRLSMETGTLLMPGHTLRFSTPHRRIAQMVADGLIGQPKHFFSRRFRDSAHKRAYRDIDPVGMTMIHDIDLGLWITGAGLTDFTAVRSVPKDRGSLTDVSGVGESGVGWHLQTAWFHETGRVPPDRVEVIGTIGSIEFEVGSGIRRYTSDGEVTESVAEDDPLVREHDVFIKAANGLETPPVTARNAYEGLLIAEAILQAIGVPATGKAKQQ